MFLEVLKYFSMRIGATAPMIYQTISKIYFSMRIGATRISHMIYQTTSKIYFSMRIGAVRINQNSDEASYTFYLAFRPGEVKIYLEAVIFVSHNFKATICYFHRLFSSSDICQSITRSGCQALGKRSSFIFAF